MITLTPTKDTGAVGKSSRALYGEPAQRVTDEMLEQQLVDVGSNRAFVADFLSGVLTHERCGRHLYRSCAARSGMPALRTRYEEFGAETERHVEMLEELVLAAGGNPGYVSPTARAIEGSDSKLLESTYLLSGSADPITAELSMLNGVFLAETMDRMNWRLVAELAQRLPNGEIRDAFEAAVAEVEAQEDEHLEWAMQARRELIMSLALGETSAGPGPADGDDGLEDATKEELYSAAQDADVPGRSQMTKAELLDALREDA